MKYYLNEWEDKKRPGYKVIDELHFTPLTTNSSMRIYMSGYDQGLLEAIDNYESTQKKDWQYVRTIVSDPDNGTCSIINIEAEIYDRRSDSEKEWDINASRGDAGRGDLCGM